MNVVLIADRPTGAGLQRVLASSRSDGSRKLVPRYETLTVMLFAPDVGAAHAARMTKQPRNIRPTHQALDLIIFV
jgi:hypothetical protein